jgi:hypothetical protein
MRRTTELRERISFSFDSIGKAKLRRERMATISVGITRVKI